LIIVQAKQAKQGAAMCRDLLDLWNALVTDWMLFTIVRNRRHGIRSMKEEVIVVESRKDQDNPGR
jgi:hypothetical protein